ncbi:hypothetical protein J2128_002448 [Methanomicrobium sp. W14]|uniref:hypothetical protein n=1 Tax=Methanomicrobium sp. W14 TaxID=2817839 RepID=UPI001AE6B0AE|nr:hypothetical protein [Methanomicrobium sp. W14]MBP2134482.1 hypothetical protein [Methanomicrobium sp. W14]
MELPRGRFERFIRGATVKSVLAELYEKKFSGCCSGMLCKTEGELIFENGEIILAESLADSGSGVLRMLFSEPDGDITAEISGYSEAQVKLAKEFNKKFITDEKNCNLSVSSFLKNPGSATQNVEPDVKTNGFSLKADNPAAGKEPEKGVLHKKLPDSGDMFSDDELILSIDEAEIEAIKKDFSLNAKDILKRIHLDHLIQTEKKE